MKSPGKASSAGPSSKKRNRPTDLSDEDQPLLKLPTQQPDQARVATWPRFLVAHATDQAKPIDKLSIFVLEKVLQGVAGVPKTLKRLRSGDLLIELEKKSHAENLLKCTHFLDTPVTVQPHNTLNSCKGIVRSPEFAHVSEQEVIDHLEPQGVTDARRFNRKVNGKLVPTNTFVLTFDSTETPKEIRLATWLLVRVDAYFPNPLRCYNCQLFGHHKDRCKRDLACARCGTPKHNSDNCVEAERCINCDGSHTAYSKDCPKWKVEKEIVRVKHTRKISFPEARRIVEIPPTPTPGFSYAAAAVARKPSKSTATQTEVSWKPAEQQTITWPYNPPHYKPSTTSSSSSSQTQSPRGRSPKASNPKPSSGGKNSRDTPSKSPKGRAKQKTLKQMTAVSPERSRQGHGDRSASPIPARGTPTAMEGIPVTSPKKGSSDPESQKGTAGPIVIQNRFGPLDSMETEESTDTPTPKHVVPRKPILPPT